MKIRLLLVDDDEKQLIKLKEYFSAHPRYEIVGLASDGQGAVEAFTELQPDAMIIDTLMPVKDGISALEEINKGASRIIAVSSVEGENYATAALNAGADYFMLKPFSFDTLERKLSSLLSGRATTKAYKPTSSVEKKITEIFMTVGIPAHIKGYQFLREAIKMAIDSPEVINSITKKLYPEVARTFNTSASKVERAIRHAIEVAWNKGRIESINTLFGVKVYSGNEKPTNGEFIALVADKMLLESV